MTRCSSSTSSSSGTDGEARRLVGLEQVLVEPAGEEGGVDAEEHVALGSVAGEDGLVHHGAGVLAQQQLHLDAGLVGERVEHVVADANDSWATRRTTSPASAPGASSSSPHATRRSRPTGARRHEARRAGVLTGASIVVVPGEHGQQRRRSSSATVAGDDSMTLLTPRVVAAVSGSPCSG